MKKYTSFLFSKVVQDCGTGPCPTGRWVFQRGLRGETRTRASLSIVVLYVLIGCQRSFELLADNHSC